LGGPWIRTFPYERGGGHPPRKRGNQKEDFQVRRRKEKETLPGFQVNVFTTRGLRESLGEGKMTATEGIPAEN